MRKIVSTVDSYKVLKIDYTNQIQCIQDQNAKIITEAVLSHTALQVFPSDYAFRRKLCSARNLCKKTELSVSSSFWIFRSLFEFLNSELCFPSSDACGSRSDAAVCRRRVRQSSGLGPMMWVSPPSVHLSSYPSLPAVLWTFLLDVVITWMMPFSKTNLFPKHTRSFCDFM